MMIALENVKSVYAGKAYACACGCSGKHSYPESARGTGKEPRGYELGDDEISPRAVKMAFNRVKTALAGTGTYTLVPEWEEELEKHGFLTVLNEAKTRMTVVYFK